ncbi:hypothetical protein HF325_000202 [Metschnikowia pulcherrima]|uniref:Uncharacterized protein n=1 Tax=Metschnikowia pulcherrima TaxID=27326 RepID=A0A8H7GVW2_9ASCO|nr:hypothetical protein HF325_000202 [Metschnikowia pulcherrima]
MTHSADEDWSIISSSDYEEDQGSTPSETRSTNSKSEHEIEEEDDLAAASMTTVRPELSGSFSASKLRVAAGPLSPVVLAQGQDADVPRTQGDSVGVGPERVAPAATQAPKSKHVATILAPYAFARQAVARSAQCVREIDAAIQARLHAIFHRPLVSLLGRVNLLLPARPRSCRFFSTPVSAVAAQAHLILYFVLLAAIAACAGGVYGTTAFVARSHGQAPIFSYKDPLHTPEIDQFVCGPFEAEQFHELVEKSSLWLTGCKAALNQKARNLWNSVLYEDPGNQNVWLARVFYHAPAKRLRYSKVLLPVQAQARRIWCTAQSFSTNKVLKPLRQHLLLDSLPGLWTALREKTEKWFVSLHFSTHFKQWKAISFCFGKQFAALYKSAAIKTWGDARVAASITSRYASDFSKALLASAKSRWQFEIPPDFKSFVANNTKQFGGKFGDTLESGSAWLTSQAGQFGNKLYGFASECHTHVDTVEKREHLFESAKAVSQQGFEIFKRRFQIAALDAYRVSKHISKHVAAKVSR